MELSSLIDALSRPDAYPHPVGSVEVIHTHASVVFLAGDHVYKIKKPVDLGFLDYSTLLRRLHMCRAEVDLNARLASGVYYGVVPITISSGAHGTAGLRVGAPGPAVEYAVHMRRLPDASRLGEMLARGALTRIHLERLAAKLAEFHRRARRGPEISAFGRFDVVAGNCRENFEQLEPRVASILDPAVFERVRRATELELEAHRGLVERRVAMDVPRDTHGDLRLEHVYFLSDREPPDDLVIVDCIEFNDRFRFADPVADIAFLIMDLRAHGARDLADHFADAYFRQTGDEAGRALLPLYVAYRSVVRAKVRAMQAFAPEVPPDTRASLLERARNHLLLALAELEQPAARPCMLLVCGLPGTGKSTIARALAAAEGFEWVRSDVVRKELAGLDARASGRTEVDGGIYTPAWNDATYDACLRRAREHIEQGRRVIVDASFREDARREVFVRAGERLGVPVRILHFTAPPAVVRERLARRVDDASDADWDVYVHAASVWEPFGPITRPRRDEVSTVGSVPSVLKNVREVLARHGLATAHVERSVA